MLRFISELGIPCVLGFIVYCIVPIDTHKVGFPPPPPMHSLALAKSIILKREFRITLIYLS